MRFAMTWRYLDNYAQPLLERGQVPVDELPLQRVQIL